MQNLCKNMQFFLVFIEYKIQQSTNQSARTVKYDVVNVKGSAHKIKLRQLDEERKTYARKKCLNKFPPCGVCYRRKEGGRDHKSYIAENVCENCG